MGNIGPRQQRFEVLPSILDVGRPEDETAHPPAPVTPPTDGRQEDDRVEPTRRS